jgi:hypothetical protein
MRTKKLHIPHVTYLGGYDYRLRSIPRASRQHWVRSGKVLTLTSAGIKLTNKLHIAWTDVQHFEIIGAMAGRHSELEIATSHGTATFRIWGMSSTELGVKLNTFLGTEREYIPNEGEEPILVSYAGR